MFPNTNAMNAAMNSTVHSSPVAQNLEPNPTISAPHTNQQTHPTLASLSLAPQAPSPKAACSTQLQPCWMRSHPQLHTLLEPQPTIHQVILDGNSLTHHELKALGDPITIALSETALEKMQATADVVTAAAQGDEPVYGVNTGFGLNSNVRISAENTSELQKRILRSHATGVGDTLPQATVRRMMALRINTLAKGHSGIRPSVVEALVKLYNSGCTPKVKSQGTVGASGDLVPLAHIGLALLGEGEIFDPKRGHYDEASTVLARYELTPVELTAKEGLCLINGTQFMAAIASEALDHSINCFRAAFPITGLSMVAMMGHTSVFDPRVSQVRQHPGQTLSADLMRIVTPEGGSKVTDSDPQDPYSLRCVPQVYGPIAEALGSILNTFEIEWNSSTDNPLVFINSKPELLSAGNFHGNILGLKCDEMAMHLSQLSSIAYPRISNLLDPNKSRGLTAFLAADPGLDSGLMTFENVAASLLSEIKAQSNPASVDSIPTCAQKEDHVAMGGYAARKAVDVASNTEKMLAVELLVATQAIHQRRAQDPNFTLPPLLEKLYQRTSSLSPPLQKDRYMEKEYEGLLQLIQSGDVWQVLEEAVVEGGTAEKKKVEDKTLEGETAGFKTDSTERENAASNDITFSTHRRFIHSPTLDASGRLAVLKARAGELRFGQLTDRFPSLNDDLTTRAGLDAFIQQKIAENPDACFTLDGSQDDFGARANLGRGNNDQYQGPNAWDEFLTRLANTPLNTLNQTFFSNTVLLGSVSLDDLHDREAPPTVLPNPASHLSNQVATVHDRTTPIIKSIFSSSPSARLAFLNGDHNNMTSIVTGFYEATGEKLTVIYLDLHADCRPMEAGPHSGNWHTALQEKGIIKNAFLVGMNPMSNNSATVDNLRKHHVSFEKYSWQTMMEQRKSLADCAYEITNKLLATTPYAPVILSICGDSVSLLPASAGNSVIGYQAEDVYRFITQLTHLNVRALNIAELKPSLSHIEPGAAGEFLTQAYYCYARRAPDEF